MAFTSVEIEEAPNEGGEPGTFELIDTQALDPVDEDPTNPLARDLTTDEATLEVAWYRFNWVDDNDDTFTGGPIFFAVSTPGWRPSLEDVAALLRVRTKDNVGEYVGIFNDDTRPTGEQVEELIDQAVADVKMRAGGSFPDELIDSARETATTRTANLIEISYLPELTGDDRTAYQSFRLTFEEQVAQLARATNWWVLAHRLD